MRIFVTAPLAAVNLDALPVFARQNFHRQISRHRTLKAAVEKVGWRTIAAVIRISETLVETLVTGAALVSRRIFCVPRLRDELL